MSQELKLTARAYLCLGASRVNRRQLAVPELKHAGRPHLKHPHWKPLSPFFDFVFDSELGSHGPHQKVCRWRVMVSQIRMSLFFPVDLPRSYRRLCMVHWCVAHCSLRPTACHAEITTFLEPARVRGFGLLQQA